MLVRLQSVSKLYTAGSQAAAIAAVSDVSLEIRPAEFLAIVGPSGCGKTTLLSIIGLLARPTAGKVLVDGTDTAEFSSDRLAHYRGAKIGFIFQAYHLLPREPAWRNAMLPLAFSERGCRGARAMALEALAEVGLRDRAEHRASQLSGGEKQRVAVARALIRRPELILADEPTGNLDSKSGREIIELIRTVAAKHGASVVLVTHDRALAETAHRIIEMQDGRIISDGGGKTGKKT